MFQYNLCYYSTVENDHNCKRISLFQYNLCYYSTICSCSEKLALNSFQYNLCYYSTVKLWNFVNRKGSFNTIFVIIQRITGQQPFGRGKAVSIQPLLLFNKAGWSIEAGGRMFQYNLCYYSTSKRWIDSI